MTFARRKQVDEIVQSALQRFGESRTVYLTEVCGTDHGLLTDVQRSLSAVEIDATLALPASPLPLAAPDLNSMEGRRLGAYELIKRIGKGGMGTVYSARRADHEFEKIVAIKLVGPGLGGSEILRRFRTERQVLAALDHPNISRLLDGGTTEEGLPYLVMEYVEGVCIDEYCDTNQLTVSQRLKLFCIVCNAVQYAHQNLVVHRDLKPGNILVTNDGQPKLLDFGIAKLLGPEQSDEAGITRAELHPMTPEYASPEQFRGVPISTSSDIYSLGLLLYHLLVGSNPYQLRARTMAAIAAAVLHAEPERPSIVARRVDAETAARRGEAGPAQLSRRLHGDLDVILLRALRKEPIRRYLSAERLGDDISRHLEHLPIRARHDELGYRVEKYVRRHLAGLLAAAAVLIMLVATSIVSYRAALTAQSERTRADARFNQVRELANFVISDLDQAIQSGPTSAREIVVRRALKYLNSLAEDSAGDPSIQRDVIKGYLKIGDLQGNLRGPNLGDLAGARKSFETALRFAQTLQASSPRDDQVRLDIARVRVRLADLSGPRLDAVPLYRAAAATFEQFAQKDPQALFDLMQTKRKLGFTLYQVRDIVAATQTYEQYAAAARRVYAQNLQSPDARRAFAFTDERVGLLLVERGQLDAGLARLRRALATYEELAGSADNGDAHRDVAMTYTLIGDALIEHHREAEAVEHFRKALRLASVQAQRDPLNGQYRRDLIQTSTRLADALTKLGQQREAHQLTEQAIRNLAAVVDQPNVPAFDVEQYSWLLLTHFPDLRDPQTARRHAERLVKDDGRQDNRLLDLLARTWDATGEPARAAKLEEEVLNRLRQQSPGQPSAYEREISEQLALFRAHAQRPQRNQTGR